uniref:Thyroglobulin type-1 domain-containing protein n=1 Tax=Timema tahoe TaxID=61484 RepID=A0A7R9IIR2_9NEOP|nr:unnamed protein product [Timema tahoe]
MRAECVVLLTLVWGAASSCPASECGGVLCFNDVTQVDCDALTGGSTDFYYRLQPNGSVCGCCPGCVKFMRNGIACDDINKCGPGLVCKANKCELDKTSCLYYEHDNTTNTMWIPSCDKDGYFSAKQCKGEKLTGSRHISELQALGRKNVTLHCDSEGNYESLQCDSSLCWCANSQTGEPYTRLVPEKLIKILPCYNQTSVGTQYLRQCESSSIAVATIREEMTAHGTTIDSMSTYLCDSDGSYASRQVSGSQVYCRDRDNSTLSGYSNLEDYKTMNCFCNRDQVFFTESNMGSMAVKCSSNGNYDTLQYDSESNAFCVDTEGFIYKYTTANDGCS